MSHQDLATKISAALGQNKQTKLHLADVLYQSVAVPFAKFDLFYLIDTSLTSETLLVEVSALIQHEIFRTSGFLNIGNLLSDDKNQVELEITKFSNYIQIGLLSVLYSAKFLSSYDVELIQRIYPGIDLEQPNYELYAPQPFKKVPSFLLESLQAVSNIVGECRANVVAVEVVELLKREYKPELDISLFPETYASMNESNPFL